LDASALLALLNHEPGRETVEEALPGAAISSVNVSEVAARLGDRRMPVEAIRAAIADLELAIHAFDLELALDTGALRPLTRALGLSLGDRACLALARRLSWPALTADRAWLELDVGVEIQAVR
jgi:PIN domain nuclease of toxin-antitoxin system